MFSTDFIFRQQENLVDNQKCQAGLRQLLMQQNIICGGFLKFEAQCAAATGTAAPATWAGAASPAPTTTGR